MDANAHFHLVRAQHECGTSRGGDGAAGERYSDRAGACIDLDAKLGASFQVHALLGGRADDLLHDERTSYAAASAAVGRLLDSHVVIGDHRGCGALEQLHGHFEVHAVAGVVLDNEEHTSLAADQGRRLDALVGGRRGKDLSVPCCVEYSSADKSDVHRFVAAAASGDHRDFFGGRRAPKHEFSL